MPKDNYWQLDEIIADHQKIPCYFHLTIPGYGFIEGNNDHDVCRQYYLARFRSLVILMLMLGFAHYAHSFFRQLAPNVRVELPYWLAEHLALNDHIELDLPKCFSQRTRNDLNAAPTCVNLNRLCPYYYRFGVKIIDLIVDETLPQVLANAFKQRLPLIMDYTQTSRLRTDRSEFIQSLDETEKDCKYHLLEFGGAIFTCSSTNVRVSLSVVYKIGHESVTVMIHWDRQKAVKIQTAEILKQRAPRGYS